MLHLDHFESLGEAFWDTTISFNANIALIEADRHRENGRWRYREVRAEAKRVAKALILQGVLPGDHCAIIMSNQAKWLISAIGIFWAGAVLVPLDYKLDPLSQRNLLAHSSAKILITERIIWQDLADKEIFDHTSVKKIWVSALPKNQANITRWEDVARQDETSFDKPIPRKRTDPACIVYSSGTSGRPKGCILSHENYLAQAQSLGTLYPMRQEERFFSILPTNHAIDFMTGFFMPLMFGSSIVHQRTLRPQFLAPTIKRYKITHMAMVPRLLKALKERMEDELNKLPSWKRAMIDSAIAINELATLKMPNHSLSSKLVGPLHAKFGGKLRLIFCGGAFVDPDIATFFYKIGLPIVIGYGLTEAGTVITVNDLKPFRPDTVGRPVQNVKIKIFDPGKNGIGEVCMKGPTLMQGYLKDEDLTQKTLKNGWLHTGDIGKIDAAGHLHLLGRAKNMIVTEGGKNIYPEEVESHFEALNGIEELAVVPELAVWPKTSSLTKDQLILVVRKTKKNNTILENIRAKNRLLPVYKRLHAVIYIQNSFPRTASLKLKRKELNKMLASSIDKKNIERF